MPREKKVQIVNELQEIFAKCNVGIFTDYRGLSTAELTELRRALRNSEVKYRVIKNTLARFAAEKAGKNELVDLFEGPVAIAFSYGDIIEPAKILANFISTSKTSLSIKGGFLSDRVLTPGDVEALAALPSKEMLIAKVLAGMQSPIVTLISCLSNPMRGFVGVLQARVKQMEGG
ncbi:50S ribosomal protein L10 [Chloroflexota bacterium]